MREENVFGIPMQVGSHEELTELARTADEPPFYACTRVEDMPEHELPLFLRKRNLRTPCEECRAICWYDPKNYIPFTKVVCMQCMAKKSGMELSYHAGRPQLTEIEREQQ